MSMSTKQPEKVINTIKKERTDDINNNRSKHSREKNMDRQTYITSLDKERNCVLVQLSTYSSVSVQKHEQSISRREDIRNSCKSDT